jgi:hypothetical protein
MKDATLRASRAAFRNAAALLELRRREVLQRTPLTIRLATHIAWPRSVQDNDIRTPVSAQDDADPTAPN